MTTRASLVGFDSHGAVVILDRQLLESVAAAGVTSVHYEGHPGSGSNDACGADVNQSCGNFANNTCPVWLNANCGVNDPCGILNPYIGLEVDPSNINAVCT